MICDVVILRQFLTAFFYRLQVKVGFSFLMTLAWFDSKQPAVVRIHFSNVLSLFRSCGHHILLLSFYFGCDLFFVFQWRLLSRTCRLRLRSGTLPTTLLKPCLHISRGLYRTDPIVSLYKIVSVKPKTIPTILIICHTPLKKLKIWKCRYNLPIKPHASLM